jgi:hypothetical protein
MVGLGSSNGLTTEVPPSLHEPDFGQIPIACGVEPHVEPKMERRESNPRKISIERLNFLDGYLLQAFKGRAGDDGALPHDRDSTVVGPSRWETGSGP